MSFILDALKKSEAERLRKDAPGFADVPVRTQGKPVSHWMWIIGVLVIINVSVLTAIYLKPGRVDEAPVDMPVTEPVAIADEVAPDTTAERPPETSVAAESVTPEVAGVEPPVSEPSAPPAIEEPPLVTDSYATFDDLRAQGVLQLPDMHLDIHVYSSNPEDRFVFVNMGKYKERSTLDEGPVVREITRDGVVLDYRGTTFLLPRQ